jgi:hypothetical protein
MWKASVRVPSLNAGYRKASREGIKILTMLLPRSFEAMASRKRLELIKL